MEEKEEKQRNKGSVIASSILIGLGLIGLVGTYGFSEWLWKLWPVSLIVLGALLIFKKSKNNKENE
ncbi:MAG: hypothetical protein J6X10_05150 [Bacteroidales bacterium]|nr:hypothetical protein [Bacteroidales bacterium]